MTLISNKNKGGREKKKKWDKKEKSGRNKSVHINGPNKGTQFFRIRKQRLSNYALTINK